jgi:class 3 adenylate cyclase/tetratricopeptide (TPR) repeat protein
MLVFFFTDIEGSTRLWEEHTENMGVVIARHDAILEEEITAAGGYITKHTGDGVTAAFEGGEPVVCALESQKKLSEEPWGKIGELRIRMGLHAGTAQWITGIEPDSGDFHGPPVNCTARIMSAAWGGQVLLTPQVLSISNLPPRASVLNLGEHFLKNVTNPQQILQLLHPDLRWQDFPPLRTLTGESIRRTVDKHGSAIADLPPPSMAVALVSATLIPILQGDLSPDSPILLSNLGILEDLGAETLRGFTAEFAARMEAKQAAGRASSMSEVQQWLEYELIERWEANDESALALRADASQLLQAVHGVQIAMTVATENVKAAFAQGLADLGSQFSEFHWMLAGVQDTMVEMRDIQQRQLAMTEEILQLQREQVIGPLTAYRSETEQPPAFLEGEDESHKPSVFVARERELSQLDEHLNQTLSGQGRVVFITGESGQGKTALVEEFALRSQAAHSDLVVASGGCNAQTGIGDPYLPFREILGLLTGDVADKWAAKAINQEQARRLWQVLPITAQALIEAGPDLVETFLHGLALIKRAAACTTNASDWLKTLEQLVQRRAVSPGESNLQQSDLFEQYSRVLLMLAGQRPLLLVLDDLQWVDGGSINLLFHLCRRIQGSRILIVGAYRPAEVALGRLVTGLATGLRTDSGETVRHPLKPVINELKRYFGDIEVDLEQAEDQQFVEALLDNEPNSLSKTFCETLYQQTRGHPLYTIELVRDMQERGDLVQDEKGRWVEGQTLNWQTLPVQVEAVIAERLGRLPEPSRATLQVACVEGETFTAEVVSRVLRMNERELIRQLSRLDKTHHLVGAQGIRRVTFASREKKEGQRLSIYRFRHIMFQRHLYNSLSDAERVYLHEDVGIALEVLHGERSEEIAIQLAHHFQEAGNTGKAIGYLSQAGDRARQKYANEEAINYYQRAIALYEDIQPDTSSHKTAIRLYENLGEVLVFTGKYEEARDAYLNALTSLPGDDEIRHGRLYRKMGDAWGYLRRFKEAMETYDRAEISLGQEPPKGAREWWVEWIEIQLARADILYFLGEVSELTGLVEKIQPIIEQYGNPLQRVNYFLTLILANNRRDRFIVSEQTLTYSRAYLEAAQELGSLHRIAHARFVLGFNLLWRGNLDEAKKQMNTALMQAIRTGNMNLQTQCLVYLTIVYRKFGQVEETADYASRSLEAAISVQNPAYIGAAKANLSWMAWKNANIPKALEQGKAALEQWQQSKTGFMFQWLALYPLISVALDQGRTSDVVDFAHGLLDPAQQALPDSLQIVFDGAMQAWERGDPEATHARFVQAIKLARDMGYL